VDGTKRGSNSSQRTGRRRERRTRVGRCGDVRRSESNMVVLLKRETGAGGAPGAQPRHPGPVDFHHEMGQPPQPGRSHSEARSGRDLSRFVPTEFRGSASHHSFLARVGPTTPTRARRPSDASVDPTEARKHAGLGAADRVIRRGGNRARTSREVRPWHRTDQSAAGAGPREVGPADVPAPSTAGPDTPVPIGLPTSTMACCPAVGRHRWPGGCPRRPRARRSQHRRWCTKPIGGWSTTTRICHGPPRGAYYSNGVGRSGSRGARS
jgi:hypothetical protein